MPENLEINSFDELKAALYEALHNSGTSPDVADYLMERFDVLCADIDNVFLSISANDIQDYYPNLSLDEAREVRDKANENLWNSGGYCDIGRILRHQIEAEVKCIRPSLGDSSHVENSLDELTETYGEKDACCEGHGLGDIEDIPR
ncbi:Uncharacterised protein [Collinsella aerofaciens]|nr:Uncharacterised protein [Collinsella aerofaciens]